MQSIRHKSSRAVLTAALASAALLLFAAAPASAAAPAPCDSNMTAYTLTLTDPYDQVLVSADLNRDGTICVAINAADVAVVVDNSDLAPLLGIGIATDFVQVSIFDSVLGDVSVADQRGNNDTAVVTMFTQYNGGQYFSHNNVLRNFQLKAIMIENVLNVL